MINTVLECRQTALYIICYVKREIDCVGAEEAIQRFLRETCETGILALNLCCGGLWMNRFEDVEALVQIALNSSSFEKLARTCMSCWLMQFDSYLLSNQINSIFWCWFTSEQRRRGWPKRGAVDDIRVTGCAGHVTTSIVHGFSAE